MKLKEFNSETLPKGSTGPNVSPKVSFNKNGCIAFNKQAVTLMELKPGGGISISQDEDEPENWYVFKGAKGYELRGKDPEKGLMVNHTALMQKIITEKGLNPAVNHRALIAGQPTTIKGDKTKYWGLLFLPTV